MKAFEKWNESQPVVSAAILCTAPEPFATMIENEKKKAWRAALKWVLKEACYESNWKFNGNTQLLETFLNKNKIEKELKE